MSIFLSQLDSNDCGVACLAMVCKHYGKDFSITRLRDVLGTDIEGTSINGLHHGAESLGFDCRKVRITKEVISESFTLPAICHVRTEEGVPHFVVLHKVKKGFVYLLDPAKGKVKKTIDEFFQSFDGLMILLYPKEAFHKLQSSKKGLFKNFLGLLTPHKKLFITIFRNKK